MDTQTDRHKDNQTHRQDQGHYLPTYASGNKTPCRGDTYFCLFVNSFIMVVHEIFFYFTSVRIFSVQTENNFTDNLTKLFPNQAEVSDLPAVYNCDTGQQDKSNNQDNDQVEDNSH